MELMSPHNNERCICSDYDHLEAQADKDCNKLLRTLETDLRNIERYLELAGNDLLNSKHFMLSKKVSANLLDILKAHRSELLEINVELNNALTEVIVSAALNNCPYCKF